MTEKANKRENLVNQYFERRMHLKGVIKSSNDMETIQEALKNLRKLPLNSNPVRCTTRCKQCGRAHAVYRKFGLCRICLRQQLMVGNVPGGRKSSW
ncbi:MAG: 30S ribosomal protein S14 [Legionellaceae bacterium]|nr:30S ribosomal protein S14 [Legionellaceae bacterium]